MKYKFLLYNIGNFLVHVARAYSYRNVEARK